MKLKRKLIPLTSMFVVVVLLATAVGALAAIDPGDETFTLVGLITAGVDPGTYVVKGQTFSLDAAVACVPILPAPCPPTLGSLVEVKGYIHAADTKYYATLITVKTATDTFDYTGELMSTSAAAWGIDTYTFKLVTTPATQLPGFYAVGDKVKATYTVDLATGDYLASKFEVVDSAEGKTYTLVGILGSFDANSWTVNSIVFDVTGATLPPFFGTGDKVQVVFTIVAGKNVASALSVLNTAEGKTFTYEGVLTAFTDTTWTLDDKYTFTLGEGVVLPPYFGLQDKVEVTFSIIDGEMVASAVRVVETFVANKVESARCENRVKDHPALLKLANELQAQGFDVDLEMLTEFFCKGFGVGEIKQAFKYASGDYTPGMLLAMRANGMSWGELKQLMKSTGGDANTSGEKQKGNDKKNQDQTQTETQTQTQEQNHTNNGKGPDPDKGNNGNGNGNGRHP